MMWWGGKNSYLVFGSTSITGGSASFPLYIPSYSPYYLFAAPFAAQLDATGQSATINMTVTGSAPNRVMTVQWDQLAWTGCSASTTVSFQASLYEGQYDNHGIGQNVGRIDFAYGLISSPCAGAMSGSTGGYASVGMEYYSSTYDAVFSQARPNSSPATTISGKAVTYRWNNACYNYVCLNGGTCGLTTNGWNGILPMCNCGDNYFGDKCQNMQVYNMTATTYAPYSVGGAGWSQITFNSLDAVSSVQYMANDLSGIWFYGQYFNQFRVTSNGLITFGSAYPYSNQAPSTMPDSYNNRAYLAFWGAELLVSTSLITYGTVQTVQGQIFVLDMTGIAYRYSPVPTTTGRVQVAINMATNSIDIYFIQLPSGSQSSIVVGVEPEASTGLNVAQTWANADTPSTYISPVGFLFPLFVLFGFSLIL